MLCDLRVINAPQHVNHWRHTSSVLCGKLCVLCGGCVDCVGGRGHVAVRGSCAFDLPFASTSSTARALWASDRWEAMAPLVCLSAVCWACRVVVVLLALAAVHWSTRVLLLLLAASNDFSPLLVLACCLFALPPWRRLRGTLFAHALLYVRLGFVELRFG